MTTVIGRYITGLFMARFWGLLCGLTILFIVLDLLSHGEEIMALEGSLIGASLRYVGLRTPEFVSQLFPFAVLLATLLTLMGLVRTSEMAALSAASVSQIRLISALAPSALLIALAQFCIEDQILPTALRELRAWGVGDYGFALDHDGHGSTWFREGSDVVRIHHGVVGDPGQGLTIFRRDEKGNLIEWIDARNARLIEDEWRLETVTRTRFDTPNAVHIDRLTWPTGLNPGTISMLATHPRELPYLSLVRLVGVSAFGTHPSYIYDVWLQKRISRPAATILMILLAVPLVQFFHHRIGGGWLLASGLALGLLFWICDGLLLTVGESGLLPPFLAAWAPALLFTNVGLYLLVLQESGQGRRKT